MGSKDVSLFVKKTIDIDWLENTFTRMVTFDQNVYLSRRVFMGIIIGLKL